MTEKKYECPRCKITYAGTWKCPRCGRVGIVKKNRKEKNMKGSWTNNKTGKIYYLIGKAINATNAQDGQEMSIYTDETGNVFVREWSEFLEKFSPGEKPLNNIASVDCDSCNDPTCEDYCKP